VRPQAAENRESVFLRKVQVEDDRIVRCGRKVRLAVGAVGKGVDDVAVFAQPAPEQRA
jgi:hypothetical protein